jgi:hypothetical protein
MTLPALFISSVYLRLASFSARSFAGAIIAAIFASMAANSFAFWSAISQTSKAFALRLDL